MVCFEITASLSAWSELLSETFFSSSEGTPAFVPLVKHLQESLGRLERFEVLTAVASSRDGKLSLDIQMYSGVLT